MALTFIGKEKKKKENKRNLLSKIAIILMYLCKLYLCILSIYIGRTNFTAVFEIILTIAKNSSNFFFFFFLRYTYTLMAIAFLIEILKLLLLCVVFILSISENILQ